MIKKEEEKTQKIMGKEPTYKFTVVQDKKTTEQLYF